MEIVFLIDDGLPSYVEAARLYRLGFEAAGLPVQGEPYAPAGRLPSDAWFLHHTIGPRFRPVLGAYNTAVVFHEWDRYPSGWTATLNGFDSVWAPSTFVRETLLASGVTVPVYLVPPPVAAVSVPHKSGADAQRPFRFLSIGEPHFRKGFHLLLEGFLAAFPHPGEATLTLKVSSSCTWTVPRADVVVVRERLSDATLRALYVEHDAYVTASLGEGLGLPVAEAIVAGLPVVANRWGGHRDLFETGAGWDIDYELVPQLFCSEPSFFAAAQRCAYSSPSAIAGALRAVAGASADERARRAARARQRLVNTHGLDRIASVIRDQYALVADSARAAAAGVPQ